MTQIEDLLRTALAEAPTPATSNPDPLADLERRVSRRRARNAGLAVVGVMVAAAIVVPLTLIGGSHGNPAPVRVPAQQWTGTGVSAVTAGDGSVWSVADHPSARENRYYVERRDPSTGRIEHSYRVPTPADSIYFGLGLIWVSGGGEGGYPTAVVSTLNPSTGAIATRQLGTGDAVGSIVFTAGAAWATVPQQSLVVSITPGTSLGVTTNPEPGHPVTVVEAGHELEVSSFERLLAPFSVQTAGGPAVPISYVTKWPILASAGGASVWARDGNSIVREDVDSSGHVSHRLRLALPTRPLAVVPSSDGGLYVSITDGALENVVYYSAAALAHSRPQPTAMNRGGQILSMTADPAGGVVFVTESLKLLHWDPTLHRP